MNPNLITTPIIPLVDRVGETSAYNLPDALHLLSTGQVSEIADVKEFQVPAVEFFFAQLGILCTDLGDDGEGMSCDADIWRKRLLDLAPMEAWNLINDDPTVSAFLQPGMSQEDFDAADPKKIVYYPDDMGTLVKSKNHGVKFSSMSQPSLWNWVTSLIEIQTMTGYEGAGNYGHQRMNGGYGYRVKAGIYHDLSASGRWISDVSKVLEGLPRIYDDYPHFDLSGPCQALTWNGIWDGKEALLTENLHPLYIDTNRRIRLFYCPDGSIACIRKGSSSTRVYDLKLNGAYGDPWAPLAKAKATADEAEASGFKSLFLQNLNLETLCNVMFARNGFKFALTQVPSAKQRKMDCVFEIKFLGKAQGKTVGYHCHTIPVPTKIVSGLTTVDMQVSLGKASSELLQMARAAERALSVGIDALSVNGSGKSADKSFSANGVKPKAIASLTKEIEASFFSFLWDFHEHQNPEGWVSHLRSLCEKEFAAAAQSAKNRTQLSFKAEAFGRNAFEGYWYSAFSKNKEGAVA